MQPSTPATTDKRSRVINTERAAHCFLFSQVEVHTYLDKSWGADTVSAGSWVLGLGSGEVYSSLGQNASILSR